MKKLLSVLLCILLCFALSACKGKDDGSAMTNTDETKVQESISVTFINDVADADIWILPQTDENLRSSLWGTATISKLKAGDKRTADINNISENGKYIVRIIDADHAYFSAKDMVLEDSYTIRFKTDDSKYEAKIISFDQNGKELFSKEAFQGVFGAN